MAALPYWIWNLHRQFAYNQQHIIPRIPEYGPFHSYVLAVASIGEGKNSGFVLMRVALRIASRAHHGLRMGTRYGAIYPLTHYGKYHRLR